MQQNSPKNSKATFTHLVLPPDTNAVGTAFGGRIMEWIDIAASIVAQRHCRKVSVTANMDDVHFISPVHLGDVVIINARINYTHKTSMEIGVKVCSENPLTGNTRHTVSAYLTFVALDSTGKPTPVPELILSNKDEKRRFKQAELRRKERLKWREIKRKEIEE